MLPCCCLHFLFHLNPTFRPPRVPQVSVLVRSSSAFFQCVTQRKVSRRQLFTVFSFFRKNWPRCTLALCVLGSNKMSGKEQKKGPTRANRVLIEKRLSVCQSVKRAVGGVDGAFAGSANAEFPLKVSRRSPLRILQLLSELHEREAERS